MTSPEAVAEAAAKALFDEKAQAEAAKAFAAEMKMSRTPGGWPNQAKPRVSYGFHMVS